MHKYPDVVDPAEAFLFFDASTNLIFPCRDINYSLVEIALLDVVPKF